MNMKKVAKKTTSYPLVIIRTREAGVHVGYLISRKGTEVVLGDARRIWRWRGANTLNELSLRGAAQEYTRISEPVARITIIGACEIIGVAPAARASLTASRWDGLAVGIVIGSGDGFGDGSGYGYGSGSGSGFGDGFGDGSGSGDGSGDGSGSGSGYGFGDGFGDGSGSGDGSGDGSGYGSGSGSGYGFGSGDGSGHGDGSGSG